MNSADASLVDRQTAAVAVIEPDKITRDSLQFLFESINLKVVTFTDAEHFLSALPGQTLTCLISEISLPGIDGLALIEQLKQMNKLLPTIILTRQNDVSIAVQAIHAGAADFIEKPFVEPVLLNRVLQIVSKFSYSENTSGEKP